MESSIERSFPELKLQDSISGVSNFSKEEEKGTNGEERNDEENATIQEN